ncbi:AI-2E family transporter [Methanoplanus sp. FWC-SCC4]|uniref:AI-2E family transporter n=1 Tax=Methanochimaera problematica TaxID=2609417 RepID=A0AA97FBL9_9EURY|nr:AI-2E family transporter [Methanoplanus sp. FWC-SCC4]WOF16087.1 AI-2E family transporter [Methanoplanus sp. FWC-SCC4]
MVPDNKSFFNNQTGGQSGLIGYLLISALIFIVLVGMHETAYLINMLILSLILAMIGTPLLYWLKEKGMSDFVSVGIIMVLYAFSILAFILLIYASGNLFVSNLPEYHSLLETRLAGLNEMLSKIGITFDSIQDLATNLGTISKVTVSLVGELSFLLMNGFFIFVITSFLLLEIPDLGRRFEKITNGEKRLSEKYQEMCNSMIKWLYVKTKTNLVLGACFGGLLYAMGVDLAIFWGVLAVILSYIPYIGLILVAIPAIILAWIQLGIGGVIIVAAGICIINAVVENVVFSKFAADDFNMPPLVVVVSLVLWTWVLGPVGMLISVPFTLMILIALSYNEKTKWITILLGIDK